MRVKPLFSLVLYALSGSLLSSRGWAQHVGSRISANANLAPATRLSGHTPGWATPNADAGAAASGTPVTLTFLLSRTPALQAAFDQVLVDQQSPASPRFHQWLSPQQIGEQYGPTLSEIASITQWLTSQGLQVTSVSPSRTFIEATGPASSASAALSTALHLFTVDGEARLAPTTEPSIPSAFAAVIRSIEGLAEIPFRPFHTVRLAEPRAEGTALTPLATSSQNAHYVYPGDFSRIYNIDATRAAGYDGTGIKVAIAAQSRLTPSDVTQLQVIAGQPAKAPNTILVPTSSDPGLVRGDEDEATLDAVRVLTTAPGVQADLVVAASNSGGVSSAIQYSINTLVDPILSISYGACENAASASSVHFYDTLFQQAAAEGISVFVSSGDSAAAGCSRAFSTPTGTESLGMGNYLCSSSYVTCLGGTEFAENGKDATFWSPTNSATFVSALRYIPEGAWNEPTVTGTNGAATYEIAGSGSGPSAYIAKPTWQTTGGTPADSARDIPDIAFSSANHDGYFACLAYIGPSADCSRGGGVIFSGTSATAPGMAAIAALLNQRLGGKQGNLNPLLYRLAASAPTSFHDVTPTSSGVAACTVSTPSICNNSTPGSAGLSGGLAGYPLKVGYDLVTGLGSLDVTNFLDAAANHTPIQSDIALTASAPSITVGESATFTAKVQATGTPAVTGSIQFFANGTAINAPVAIENGSATSASIVFPNVGSSSIMATYSGDSNYAGSTSTPITLSVLSVPASVVAVSAAPATIAIGQSTTYSATVAAASGSGPTATGTVQFALNGNPVAGPQAMHGGVATLAAAPATAGTYALTAVYGGDTNYAPSTSAPTTLVISANSTTTSLSLALPVISAGDTTVLTAHIMGDSGRTPSGTVQFLSAGALLGQAAVMGSSATLTVALPVAAMYPISAVYSGDAAFNASSSPEQTINVVPVTAVSSLSVATKPTTATLSSAAAASMTGSVTLATPNSFTGAVTLVCTVVAAVGNPTTPPTCALSSNSIVFNSAQTATATITLSAAAPRDQRNANPLALLAPGAGSPLGSLSLASLLLLLPAARRRHLRSLMIALPLLVLGVMLPLTGCGSSISSATSTGTGSTTQTVTGASAGSYIVTLIAANGAISATNTIALTIN